MKILELKFNNILGHKEARFEFGKPNGTTPLVYVIQGSEECTIFTTAIQLICSSKYDSFQKLQPIWPSVKGGIVEIVFALSRKEPVSDNAEDHSSDSDAPCTSQQAKRRAEERRKRCFTTYVIKAQREFHVHPLTVDYSINNGPLRQSSVQMFNMMFFSCTDIIFPHLSSLRHDDCKNGRWLELLSTDIIYKGEEENNLILKFCKMYSNRKIIPEDPICQMTTSYLIGRYSLNETRIAQLIQIFQDIRCIFEYLTFDEYTVWFLLPQLYGDVSDITEIRTDTINFDFMQTKIQVKSAPGEEKSSPKYPWTDAIGFVRELFLVAVQLAFGFSCEQNIVYLHSLESVYKHQSFEYIRCVFAHNSGGSELSPIKDYLQRIVDACVKCSLTCIIEYNGGIPFKLKNCFFHRLQTVNLEESQQSRGK